MRFDVMATIAALGIEPTSIEKDGTEIWARCPYHDDRGKPNWSINAHTGQHHCFNCKSGGYLESLVAHVKGMRWAGGQPDLGAAKVWLRRFGSTDLSTIRNARTSKDLVRKPKAPETLGIEEMDLGFFSDVPQWALDARHLDAGAATQYEVRWDEKREAWILPIRAPWSHDLLGWQLKGQRDRLFRNHPVGVYKAASLFGLRAFTGGRAVLVESPLDVLRLATAGISGGLATYGAAVSDKQVDVLCSYADSVIVAMDNPRLDEAGKRASLALVQQMLRDRIPTKVFDYDHTDAKDIGDMSDEQIHLGITNARGGWQGRRAVHSK